MDMRARIHGLYCFFASINYDTQIRLIFVGVCFYRRRNSPPVRPTDGLTTTNPPRQQPEGEPLTGRSQRIYTMMKRIYAMMKKVMVLTTLASLFALFSFAAQVSAQDPGDDNPALRELGRSECVE